MRIVVKVGIHAGTGRLNYPAYGKAVQGFLTTCKNMGHRSSSSPLAPSPWALTINLVLAERRADKQASAAVGQCS